MKHFAGRTAITTGGGSGLGRAATERLSSEGGKIVIVDKDGVRGSAATDQLRQLGGRAQFL